MSKLISLASFAALALTAGLAHAEPPCPGSNGNGCSWTCSGSTYYVTCQNTSVGGFVPRCYEVTGGTTTSVPCNQAPTPPGDINVVDAAFELIFAAEDDIQELEGAISCYEADTAEEAFTEAAPTR